VVHHTLSLFDFSLKATRTWNMECIKHVCASGAGDKEYNLEKGRVHRHIQHPVPKIEISVKQLKIKSQTWCNINIELGRDTMACLPQWILPPSQPPSWNPSHSQGWLPGTSSSPFAMLWVDICSSILICCNFSQGSFGLQIFMRRTHANSCFELTSDRHSRSPSMLYGVQGKPAQYKDT
jgi:hypothetical protein